MSCDTRFVFADRNIETDTVISSPYEFAPSRALQLSWQKYERVGVIGFFTVSVPKKAFCSNGLLGI